MNSKTVRSYAVEKKGEVRENQGMNPPKVNEYDYINFLIAAQKTYSCTEAERVKPESANAAAHDAVTRLWHRMEPSTQQFGKKRSLKYG
jgi:hypothetical protein